MIPHGVDPNLIDALNRASGLELFQLSTIIERLMADPRRILQVRVNLHLGQTVRFLDWRDGEGKCLARRDHFDLAWFASAKDIGDILPEK